MNKLITALSTGLSIIALGAVIAFAQSVTMPPPAGTVALLCVFNDTPPTLTTGQVAFAQCDSTGHIAIGTDITIADINLLSQYPKNSTPITSSVTGTTAATTATLAAAGGKLTFICGYWIDADATAATVVASTITGTKTGTLNQRQGVGAVASGTVRTQAAFNPCIPSSAVNTGIAVISGAAGTLGNTAVTAWGYQL